MSPLTKKIVNMRAKLVTGTKSFDGFIENVSDNEIYVITRAFSSFPDFTSGTPVTLHLESSSNGVIDLQGRIKWTYMTPPHGLTSSLGIEITGSHLKYGELFAGMQ